MRNNVAYGGIIIPSVTAYWQRRSLATSFLVKRQALDVLRIKHKRCHSMGRWLPNKPQTASPTVNFRTVVQYCTNGVASSGV